MSTSSLTVDTDFPGGNIAVDAIDGDCLTVHPDFRDTEGTWFYWYFRVHGAAGRTIAVDFTQYRAIGTRGPAVSFDGAATWAWLGAAAVDGHRFVCTIPKDAPEVRFSFGMPYTGEHLDRFLAPYDGHPRLRRETLCLSRDGRDVPLLRVGCLSERPRYRALVTCRHHCCEMMASYALEGLLAANLASSRELELLVVPFADRDGVERGDQGKNRRPRDHNRDYDDQPIYPETTALIRQSAAWADGSLVLALDLHCPHISGQHNECLYQVGASSPAIWQEQQRFGACLEAVARGPLPYRAADDLPFGQAWNTGANFDQGRSCARWAGTLPGIRLASSFEIPYASVGEAVVTPDTARAFGTDLAAAIDAWLGAIGT